MAQRRWPTVLVGLGIAAGLLVWALAWSSIRLRSTLVCGAALQNLATTAAIHTFDLPTGLNATSQDRIAALIHAGSWPTKRAQTMASPAAMSPMPTDM